MTHILYEIEIWNQSLHLIYLNEAQFIDLDAHICRQNSAIKEQ